MSAVAYRPAPPPIGDAVPVPSAREGGDRGTGSSVMVLQHPIQHLAEGDDDLRAPHGVRSLEDAGAPLLGRHHVAQRRVGDGHRREELRLLAVRMGGDLVASDLQRDPQGLYSVVRLPAEGDPMMGRVERIRNQEHLFVDTVDEQYVNLYEEMAPTYNLWRQYGREQAIYQQEYEAQAQTRERYGRRGSFTAMEQTYNMYKQIKIQEQDLDEMAQGFNNEVVPTVMEANGTVFRLSGTLETQYNEWRGILRDIFVLETGLPAGT